MSDSRLTTNHDLQLQGELDRNEIATSVGQFIHEINNPLAAVLGQVQLLLREDLHDRIRDRVVTIESQVKRIQEITRRLNDRFVSR